MVDSRIDLVERLLEEGRTFTFDNFCFPNDSYPGQYGGESTPEWSTWKTRARNLAHEVSSENSAARRLADEGFKIMTNGHEPARFEHAHANLLKSIEMVGAALKKDVYGELRVPEGKNASPALSNRIFIVHGHDQALKTDVERFIKEIGLEPVVLHRQPDSGATVIEKFEKHSDVGYAFILLTPDEIAYTTDQVPVEDAKRKKEYRARPNVIFEFGYFVGKLGRNRVCCIYKQPASMPSDLRGLVYKQVTSSIDEQAYPIIRELKAAGYEVKI